MCLPVADSHSTVLHLLVLRERGLGVCLPAAVLSAAWTLCFQCISLRMACLQEQQKAWSVNLNGFDIEEAKILRLSGKPQNAPEGMTQGLCELTQLEGSGQRSSNTEALCVDMGEINWLFLRVPVCSGVFLLRVLEIVGWHKLQ